MSGSSIYLNRYRTNIRGAGAGLAFFWDVFVETFPFIVILFEEAIGRRGGERCKVIRYTLGFLLFFAMETGISRGPLLYCTKRYLFLINSLVMWPK